MDINDVGNSIGDGLANAARGVRSALPSWLDWMGFGPGLPAYQSVQDTNDTGKEISEAITTYGPAYVERGTLAQDAAANQQQTAIGLGVLAILFVFVLSLFRR